MTNFEFLYEPGFWLVNIPLMLVPIAIFFLNMQPTHKVLAEAKAKDLKTVEGHIKRASSSFLERLDGGQEAGLVAQEISALAVLEQRLQAARTWPYDVGMLRTLFVSVLVPIFTMLGKLVIDKILA